MRANLEGPSVSGTGGLRMPWLSTAEPTFTTESGDRLFTYGASDSSWRSWGYGSA